MYFEIIKVKVNINFVKLLHYSKCYILCNIKLFEQIIFIIIYLKYFHITILLVDLFLIIFDINFVFRLFKK